MFYLTENEQSGANVRDFLRVVSWICNADCLVPASLKEIRVDVTVNFIFTLSQPLVPSVTSLCLILFRVFQADRQDGFVGLYLSQGQMP